MATRLAVPDVLSGVCEAAEHIARHAFTDSAVGPVGLELESHSVDVASPHRRVGWRRLQELAGSVGELPGAGAITFEPGGAVELSGPPMPTVETAIACMRLDHRQLVSTFRSGGVGLPLLGADPLRSPERINPGARYGAMARHFGATGRGGPGLQMMTCTASLQVNLQAGRRRQWRERFELAQALGPVLVAIAAASPMLEARPTGFACTRQHIWSGLDPRRSGPVPLGDDPAESWSSYALAAPVMLVRDNGDAEAVVTDVSFADWVDGRELLGRRRPTLADLDYHLTTLFPPVRPRGWMELRYLDACDETWWPALTFLTATLLDNPRVSGLAAEAVAPVAHAWETASRVGLADPQLYNAARLVVAVAAEQAPPVLVADMARLVEMVDRKRCPADDFLEDAKARGVTAAFAGVSA